MRHRGAADLSVDHALAEVAERDISPDIAAQIEQNRVGALQRVEILANEVMRFDLRRGGVGRQAEIADEACRESGPIDFRIGRHVGIPVARGTVDLAHDLDLGQLLALADEAVIEHREFLAEGGG